MAAGATAKDELLAAGCSISRPLTELPQSWVGGRAEVSSRGA